jgi:hypothetical protein
MNQPTHGALFTAFVLILIGALTGGYVGFFLGALLHEWTEKVSRRIAEWIVGKAL